MHITSHVKYAIGAYAREEFEHSLLHSCLALDYTARKMFAQEESSRSIYIKCLREYYWLLSAFTGGVDLSSSQFNQTIVIRQKNKKIPKSKVDFAEIIYYIFRCSSAHAGEIPPNYKFCEINKDGSCLWGFGEAGELIIPLKIIFALLAVTVFCKHNADICSEGSYYLSYETERTKNKFIFTIKDYWGKEEDIRNLIEKDPPSLIVKSSSRKS